ncbi:hypothetical protein RB600_006209 [Gaeumannomyces tritici]
MKIITVFGATGNQGGAIVDTFVSDPKLKEEWAVRGIARDVTKPAAQALAAKGVEVISADMNDESSLVKALAGSYAVFAVTNYWETLDMQTEINQGKNVVDAAKETGVQHFIFSSLINVSELTKGKLDKVYHFDGKAKVEEYARSLNVPSTFFMPGFYLSGLDGGMMLQTGDDKAWTLALPTPGDAPIPIFHAGDSGKYIKAIVLNRDSLLGKQVPAASEYLTPEQLIAGFRATFPRDGASARFVRLSHEEFIAGMRAKLPGAPDFVAEEVLQNMRLFAEGGYYGGRSLGETVKLVEGVGEKLTSWPEFLKTAAKTYKGFQ